MKHSRKSHRAIALTLRPVASGALVLVLFVISLAGLFFGRSHPALIEDVRMAIADRVTPIVETLAVMDAMSSLGNWMHDMAALREENLKLKSDNARLMRWQAAATDLASENEKLRALLKFAPAAQSSYISARVAVDTASPYSRSVVIGAGSAQGVEDDSAVVNETGLVGRVIETGQKTSRVLLLTDINSRIPVIAQNSREHAIAGGMGTDMLNLLYLPENTKMKEGETLVTSGDGAVLPPGLPVGVITKLEKGVATVQTFADWHRLEYVSVVDFTK